MRESRCEVSNYEYHHAVCGLLPLFDHCVAESRRFEYWNDVVLRHCIPAASVPMAGVDFDARLAVRGVGMVDICSLSAPLHRWERTARYLRQGPDDDLWLGYMQGGYGQLEQGGRKGGAGGG